MNSSPAFFEEKSSSRQRKFATLRAVVCVLLIGLVALLQWRAVSLERSLHAQTEASHQRQKVATHYLSLLQDIETGQRGFFVTGNPLFLQPYNEALRDLAPTSSKLLRSYLPGTLESALVGDILRTGDAKIRYTRHVIAVRSRRGEQAANAFVGAGLGKQLMDHARWLVARIERLEGERSQALVVEAQRERASQQQQQILAELALLFAATSVAAALLRTIRGLERSGRSLADAVTRQSAIFEGASDAMMMLDDQGRIVSLNGAAERLFGQVKADLIGRPNLVLFADPPSQETSLAYLRRLEARDERVNSVQTFVGRRADGSEFETEVATTPIRLHDGLHFLAASRDVTERSRVERMKTEFVATVSHELRTPLTSIAGSLGLLSGGAGGELGEKARRLIDIALNNSQRLIRMINDMLDIEKIESGKMTFDTRRLALRELLEEIIQANIGFAQKNRVHVSLVAIPSDAEVLADRDRIEQVFTNLLSNAIKFSPTGATVAVTALPLPGRWRISVADHGAGIPEAFRGQIFGKFAQADGTDSRLLGGSGLGLSIVKEIVDRSGGEVSFTSEEGKGSVFTVDLPAPPVAFPIDGAPLKPVRIKHEGRPHLLHVEDDVDTLRVVSSLLEGKVDVLSTPSVREADAALRRFQFDAVLLDVALDDGRGLNLVPLIRASNPHAPILLFTALDVSPADQAQVDAVIIKSRIDLAELAPRLLQLIDANVAAKDAA